MNTANLELHGEVGKRLRRVKEYFLTGFIDANPAIVEQFFQRDTLPQMKMTAWSGEFCGKYLCSCAAVYRLLPDENLKAECARLMELLCLAQDGDGYLGPFKKSERLIGKVYDYNDDCLYPHWDIWGHYHITIGFLEWYAITGNTRYLDAARRIAALIADCIDERDITNDEHFEMKAAYLHAFAKLYSATRERKYMEYCDKMLTIFEKKGRFLEDVEAGKEFYQSDYPRWETMYCFAGFAELYKITRNDRYLRALRKLYDSICRNDIHNTGAFSAGEKASGNAYTFEAIETCCTVAWLEVLYDLYDITGDVGVIETIERAYYNTVMASIHPSGKWSTYSTPMKGLRIANHNEIIFQSAACTDANCCSVNAPRALAGVYRWAIAEQDGCTTVNWLSDCTYTDAAHGVTVRIESQYPYDGAVKVSVTSREKRRFCVRLPAHADSLTVTVDGKPAAVDGKYVELCASRATVEIDARFSVRVEQGDKDLKDLCSLYYGPLLLSYDRRFNAHYDEVPVIESFAIEKTVPVNPLNTPNFLVKAGDAVLCEFDYAGCNGTEYTTWVKVR